MDSKRRSTNYIVRPSNGFANFVLSMEMLFLALNNIIRAYLTLPVKKQLATSICTK